MLAIECYFFWVHQKVTSMEKGLRTLSHERNRGCSEEKPQEGSENRLSVKEELLYEKVSSVLHRPPRTETKSSQNDSFQLSLRKNFLTDLFQNRSVCREYNKCVGTRMLK